MTPEEITMIRTALRSHGEKVLAGASSKKWTGPQFRKIKEDIREEARVFLRLADQPDEHFRTPEGSPPEINYVIEYSMPGREWKTWDFVPQSEMIAKHEWRNRLPGADHRGNLRFRLVKRTALITDEILDIDNPEN
jgi:hypothetical protein